MPLTLTSLNLNFVEEIKGFDPNQLFYNHMVSVGLMHTLINDAGASLHVIKHQPANTSSAHSIERRGTSLSLSNFKFELNVL
jgi:hypothetical protein